MIEKKFSKLSSINPFFDSLDSTKYPLSFHSFKVVKSSREKFNEVLINKQNSLNNKVYNPKLVCNSNPNQNKCNVYAYPNTSSDLNSTLSVTTKSQIQIDASFFILLRYESKNDTHLRIYLYDSNDFPKENN